MKVLVYLLYKFSAKEKDEETGLYYYGARYLDPKYSMWISTDPALGEYIPKAPINEEAKRYNQNLPGLGGVYNHINFQLYHYAGNNPIKYTDPDGRVIKIDESEGQDFVQDVKTALEYLRRSETAGKIIKELENSTIEFIIKKCDWINSFDEDRFDGDKTIFWSPCHTFKAGNGEYNSPAVCLIHELVHAWVSKTQNGKKNFNIFCEANKVALNRVSLKLKEEEFATAIERLVAENLGEPIGRKRYKDLKIEQKFGIRISLPKHNPLMHSGSRSQ